MCATVGKALGKHWTIECQCIKQQRFWRTLFMKYKSTCSTNGKAWSRINGAPFFILFHHPSTPTQRQCIYCTPHLESIGFLPVSLWILLSVLDRLFCASSRDRCSILNSAAIFCHYHAVISQVTRFCAKCHVRSKPSFSLEELYRLIDVYLKTQHLLQCTMHVET